MHNCYACDRVFSYDEGGATARFPLRFEGPPGNVNGGVIVGALACPALKRADDGGAMVTRASVRLRASVPHETQLAVDVAPADGGKAVTIRDGDNPLVSGTVEMTSMSSPAPGSAIAEVPAERVADIASLALVEVPDRPPFFEETGDHPIAACFSCGPKHPDGLHIYPRVAGDGITCAPWNPAPEFDDGGGVLSTMVLTSALDCSSGICMPVHLQRELIERDQFFLLGSLDAHYLRVPSVGRDYRVAARALLRDGRKFFGLSALFDNAGTPYAYVEATWIVASITRTEAFGPR